MWHVAAGVQDVFSARRVLAATLGEPEARFAVVSPDVGGSFGLKGIDPELVLTVWAARRLRRPVKWVADRSEAFAADNHGRDNVSEAALAIDRNGMFLGLEVETWASLGAYPAYFGPAPPVNNLGTLAGVYRTPAIAVRVNGVLTNAAPTGPYRGAGRPEAAYVIERMVDLAARALDIDRAEIRRRNMIPPEAMPFRTALTFTYDVGDFPGVLERALAAAEHGSFEGRRAAARTRGLLRGIGLAAVIERATIRQTLECVEVRITATGNGLVIAGSTDQGQGHRTMYTQIACDRLGLDPAAVQVVEADSSRLPTGGMTGSSRVSAMGSGAALKAIEIVLAKARQIAAHALEAAAEDFVLVGSRFVIAGTDRGIDLAEVARRAHAPSLRPPGLEPGLAASASHVAAAENFPNGVHVCELEIDPETGRVRIVRYVVVDDVGTMINPHIVHGQIHGGVAQGIGEALLEQVVYDAESGQLLSGSFMDYAMPRADDLCFLEVASHPVPTATNPLGVKGAGEAGVVGALPAVIGAVVDALSPLGIAHIDMPATSEQIWRAILAAGGMPAADGGA
jgi:carbon-monoxide dehydrogenase large subunit